ILHSHPKSRDGKRVVAETVSEAIVFRRELMGGTLTTFTASGRGHVLDRGEYIDTLLGPERTDVLSRQKDDPLGSPVIPASTLGVGVLVRGVGLSGCVV
uniref:hypothetical protein n=1 Tax=Nocardia amikacinitolerans TaxID=756689 RepID=UPI001C3F81E5